MKTPGKFAMIVTIIFLNMTLVVSSCQKDEAASLTTSEEKTSTSTTSATSNCNCMINPFDSVTQAEIDMLL